MVNPYQPTAVAVPDLDPHPATAELASRGSRLGAAMLDFACFFAIGILAGAGNAIHEALAGVLALLGWLALGGVQAYLISANGQTLGKRWLGIKIVRLDGSNPGFASAVGLRTLVNGLLNVIPIYGIVDALFIFRDDRRCVHDLIAGTRVVRA